jgi:hypothetical protein
LTTPEGKGGVVEDVIRRQRAWRDWKSRLVHSLLAGLLALPVVYATAADEPKPTDAVARALVEARAARSAEVFVVPLTLSTITNIQENQVPAYGCRYVIDMRDMAELLDIIERADITERKDATWRVGALHMLMLVRLHHGEGSTDIAFEGSAHSDANEVVGTVNRMRAGAAPSFPGMLRNWVSHLPLSAHRPSRHCQHGFKLWRFEK